MPEIATVWIAAATNGATAFAETISMQAMKDNTIYSESEFTNGGGQYFFAGLNIRGAERRALMAFDVAGALPAGSTIQSVSVILYMSMTHPQASPIMVSFHRLTSDWGEGTAVGPRGEGGGAAPGPGDATWSYNFYDSSRWTMPGADGDRAQDPSAVGLVLNAVDYHTWQSTAALVADVQSWLDSPNSNFGWQLIGSPTVGSAKRFDSRENSNEAFRPVLQVTYAPPLAGDGGLPDGGLPDGGVPDGGVADGGSDGGPDSGVGMPDSGMPDSGIPDSVRPDGGSSSTYLTRGCGCHSLSGSFTFLVCSLLLFMRFRRPNRSTR